MITSECLQYLRGLTTSLQEEAKDIVQAVSEIKTLTSSLKQVRENVDSYHSRWFETVSKMCNEVRTTPSMPRICGRQRHRASIPASNPSEYCRRTIPSVLVTEDLATVSNVGMKVGELYAVDLPNVPSLSSEIHNWYTKWKSEEEDHGSKSLPSTLSSSLTKISSFYPNIKALVTILCTLPVTYCTAERSSSGLKRINTVLRSSMSNERLSSPTLLHMHQDIPIDIEEVIDEFSRCHPW